MKKNGEIDKLLAFPLNFSLEVSLGPNQLIVFHHLEFLMIHRNHFHGETVSWNNVAILGYLGTADEIIP